MRGETIHTENSYKYTLESFQALARLAGWNAVAHWTSPAPEFAVFLLKPIWVAAHPPPEFARRSQETSSETRARL